MLAAAAVVQWSCLVTRCDAATAALWLFDEQAGVYPSCVLGDAASGDFPLVIGPGGQIVAGKFGNALEAVGRPPVDYPRNLVFDDASRQGQFGLIGFARNSTDLMWRNANFCALMTRGERHLRQEVGFGSPTSGSLNLGDYDWTVEFWYHPSRDAERPATVFEIGTGPRAAGCPVTRLSLNEDAESFTLFNEPGDVRLPIASSATALDPRQPDWHHFAFVYDKAKEQLRHYVDGVVQPLPGRCRLKRLPVGDEDYLSVGRDGRWQHRLPGRLDELRISDGQVYRGEFQPPGSFSKYASNDVPPPLEPGLPLLFASRSAEGNSEPVQLGSRKYLFLDDALVAEQQHVQFRPNPPRLAELVIEKRGLSNHLVVFEDVASGDGLIRLYRSGPKKSLDVWTSRDGVHFTSPDLGREYLGAQCRPRRSGRTGNDLHRPQRAGRGANQVLQRLTRVGAATSTLRRMATNSRGTKPARYRCGQRPNPSCFTTINGRSTPVTIAAIWSGPWAASRLGPR